ncbi:hypothetical protein BASA83_009746 [Batrachochytrium salamandrivorans]|nr:hypothetical protein BASA83_009746 [Batrachochytrium salamandrivorans]
MFGCFTIATTTTPTTTLSRVSVQFIQGADPIRKEDASTRISARASTLVSPPLGASSSTTSQSGRPNPHWQSAHLVDTHTDTKPAPRPFTTKRLLALPPNSIIWFLNAAFVAALLVLCTVSLTHWSIAYNNHFDITACVLDWNTMSLVVVLQVLQRITQALYFLTSVWMKHRLVQSLPGASSAAIIWTTSITICVVAILPSVVQIRRLIGLSDRMFGSIAILMLGFCMSILAWIYVFLSVINIKAATLSYKNTISIIRNNRLLNRWLIVRPLLLAGISIVPLLIVTVKRAELDLTGYVAIIIISDFLFEYQQIQKGLFAMLVREICLPPNIRHKLDQVLCNDGSQLCDDSWGDHLNDDPKDFEFDECDQSFHHYDFGAGSDDDHHSIVNSLESHLGACGVIESVNGTVGSSDFNSYPLSEPIPLIGTHSRIAVVPSKSIGI